MKVKVTWRESAASLVFCPSATFGAFFMALCTYLRVGTAEPNIYGPSMPVAGENIVTNNNLGKNNLSITPYAKTTW